MRTTGLVRFGLQGLLGAVAVVATSHASALVGHSADVPSPFSSFPSPSGARAILDATHHHGEWVTIVTGDHSLLAAVTYPDRRDRAPVVVVVARSERLTPWVRAVADQLTEEGYIAVVPDAVAADGASIAAARQQFAAHPAATGRTALITLESDMRIESGGSSAHFALSTAAWSGAVNHLDAVTDNNKETLVHMPGHAAYGEAHESHDAGHAQHAALSSGIVIPGSSGTGARSANGVMGAAAPAQGAGAPPAGARRGYPGGKLDSLPAGLFTEKTAASLQKLGKAFEPHVYPHATHGFLEFQDLGGNPEATRDSWARAIAFLQARLR